MISIITIILFFLYLWGLGYTATYRLTKPEHSGERQLLNLAVGLGIFPILSIIINFFHLPLDWKLFLALSLAFPLFILIRKMWRKQFSLPSFKFTFTKSDMILVVVLIIVAAALFMYVKGTFAYPYLEDEDPWGHAVGVKYVALEKTGYDPLFQKDRGLDPVLAYIDPVPPAYDILLGILHQTSPDLTWTLKFFNALLISLGLIFFYLFAQEFIGNRNKALLATFMLAAVPAYLSHFIWSHGLAVTLFFPTMYALLRIREDPKWFFPASLAVASIWVSQNLEEPIKLTTLLLLFILVASIATRRFFRKEAAAVLGGMALSLLWWGTMVHKHTFRGLVRYFTGEKIFSSVTASPNQMTSATGFLTKISQAWNSLTSPGGSGSRAYSVNDFLFARGENMINNPIGIGLVVSLLVLLAVVFILWRSRSLLADSHNSSQNSWLLITLFWLIYLFWGVNGQTFPISIARGPFRIWLLLAIPVALLAAEGAFVLLSKSRRWNLHLPVLLLILLGVLVTSGYPKYQVNTAVWPTSGSFTLPNEPWEYAAWFDTLPLNTKVFLYSPRDKLVIGFGRYSCLWCEEVLDFREGIIYQDAVGLHSFLRQQGYEYLVINGRMDAKYVSKTFGENATSTLLPQRYSEILNSGLFTPVYQKDDLFLALKVNR